MRIYYEETYGKYYNIDASTSDEATKELDCRIREGREDQPARRQGIPEHIPRRPLRVHVFGVKE